MWIAGSPQAEELSGLLTDSFVRADALFDALERGELTGFEPVDLDELARRYG